MGQGDCSILFELLTGQRPFTGRTAQEVTWNVQHGDPARPRALVPALPRDLEKICLCCLERSPEQRYASAADLADDLDRFLRGEPISPPSGASVLAAPLRWVRRHPIAAATIAIAALLVPGVTTALFLLVDAQEEDLRRDILRANVFAARTFAGTALFQLKEYADRVQTIAADPALAGSVHTATACSNSGAEILQRHGAGSTFDSVALFDTRGSVRLHWPLPARADYLRTDFSWRDYFVGARRAAARGSRRALLSRAILAESDGLWKLVISAPMFDPDGRWVGVVIGTLGTDSMIGDIQLQDPDDPGRIAVLAGPRDNDRSCRDCPLPEELIVVLHDDIEHGSTLVIKNERVRRIRVASPGSEPFRLSTQRERPRRRTHPLVARGARSSTGARAGPPTAVTETVYARANVDRPKSLPALTSWPTIRRCRRPSASCSC